MITGSGTRRSETHDLFNHGTRIALDMCDHGEGHCKRTSEESGTIGGWKEKEFVDDDLTTGKHPTI